MEGGIAGDPPAPAPAQGVQPLDPSGLDILDTTAAGGAAIRGGILRVLGYGATVGLSVVSAALLIRHLGPRDFGRYTAVFSLVTVVAGLTEAGMTSVGVREFAILPPERRMLLIRHLLGLRLVVTSLGVAAAVLFALAVHYDRAMVVGTAVAGLGVVLAIVQATYTVPLQAALRFGSVAAIDLLRQAATVIGIVLLVLAGASILPLLGVPAAAGVVALVATYAVVRGTVPIAPWFDRGEFRRLLGITLPYAAATAVGVIYAYLAVVLMSIVSSRQETGYFGAAFRVFVVIGGVTGPLVTSAFPVLVRAAHGDTNRLAYALERLWETALLLGAFFAVCVGVGAPVAIDVVAGPGFDPSVNVLRIQAAAVVFTFLLATWGYALLSLGRYAALLVTNAIGLAVSATLTLALAPSHGALGASFAIVAGEAALAIGYAVALMRRRPELRVELQIVPKVAAAAGAAALMLLIPGLGDPARLVLAAMIFAAVALAARAVPAELWEAVTRRGRAA